MRNEHSVSNERGLCEPLESRTLLTAFKFFLDGTFIPGPQPVDFGTVALGSAGPTRTIRYQYLGDLTVDVRCVRVNGDAGFAQIAGDEDTKTLSKNQSFTVTYQLLTGRATPRISQLVFFYDESNGDGGTKEFPIAGNVLPANVNSSENLGALTNATKTPSGSIAARKRLDGEGTTLEQIAPYLGAFELTAAQSKIDLKLTGTSMPVPAPEDDRGPTTGELSALIVRDTNNDGKLSIAEREAGDRIQLTSGFIAADGSSTQSLSQAVTRGAGKYLLFVSAEEMEPNNVFVNTALEFKVTLKVDDIVPPIFDVRGPGNQSVARGATIELGTDQSAVFTVKNTGEATLTVTGQKPDVTGGAFSVFEDGLNSSIGANASDTFKVKLLDTTPGQKSGTITIKSSNAQGGDFSFTIRTTVAGPIESFVTKQGSTLRVLGTALDDGLTSTVSDGAVRFTLNGEQSDAFSVSEITKIVIDLLDGNDNYSSATQLDIKQTINGGNGNDLIRGGKQADYLSGGEGDDRMDGRTRGDVHDGGPGSDTAIYRQRRATEPVTVTIDEVANDGGSSDQSKDNVLSSTEHIQGGLGNDHLTGSSKTNRLFGFEGNDTLLGLKGNDTLDGGSGANNISAGFGNDTIFSRNTIGDIIDGGADTDSLVGDVLDDISNVENPNLA